MLYEIYHERQAAKTLEGLDDKTYERVQKRIDDLATNPRPRGTEKLADDLYRVISGRWRIIYYVDDRDRRVIISRIRLRTERTYRNV